MPMLANPRHERFAQEMAKGTSAPQAYYLAGYVGICNISRLKNHPPIAARIEELLTEGARRTEVTAAATITNFAASPSPELRGLFNKNGVLKPGLSMARRPRPGSGGARHGRAVRREWRTPDADRRDAQGERLANKLRALEMLGRSFGLFKDKVEVRTSVEQMSDEELSALVAELRDLRSALAEGAAELQYSRPGGRRATGWRPTGPTASRRRFTRRGRFIVSGCSWPATSSARPWRAPRKGQ